MAKTDVKMKPIKLNVFEVKMTDTMSNFPLARKTYESLKKTGKVKDRLVSLNPGESGDADFVSKMHLVEDTLCGTFVRLNHNYASTLRLSDLEVDEVELSKMINHAREDNAGSIKSIAFFCLYGHTLVMANSYNNLKALKSYLTSFLEKNGEPDIRLEFTQLIKPVEALGTTEIKSIEIRDGAYLNPKFTNTGLKTKLRELTSDIISKVFDGLIPESDLDNLVKAYLVLKLNRKVAEKDKTLQVALKLIDDSNIIVTGKNGQKVTGREISVIEERQIELTSDGVINEFMLEQEMKQIAKEYNKKYESN